jgi:hypothetical protein
MYERTRGAGALVRVGIPDSPGRRMTIAMLSSGFDGPRVALGHVAHRKGLFCAVDRSGWARAASVS